MSPDASFIPPDVTPPEPPEAKVVAFGLSIFMTLVMLVFVGFILVEFFADMAGHPLFLGKKPAQEAVLPPERDRAREFKSPVELITPQHQTQMPGPEVVAIYTERSSHPPTKPPSLLLNGNPHPWEVQYGDNTWFARLKLEAGEHHLQVEECESDFFVVIPNSPLRSPEFWAGSRPHPETKKDDRCFACHEVFEEPVNPLLAKSGRAIGAWRGIASCFLCHEEESHDTTHAYIMPTSNQCLQCHTIH